MCAVQEKFMHRKKTNAQLSVNVVNFNFDFDSLSIHFNNT